MLKFGILGLFILCLRNSWGLLISLIILRAFLWFLLESSYSLGVINFILVDNYSIVLVVLVFWISALILIISFYIKDFKKFYEFFGFLVVIIMFFLIFTFRVSNYLLFYIFFEARLIPIFLIVIGWGYQPERISASYYLLFYTLLASLPLLLILLIFYDCTGSLDFSLCYNEILFNFSWFFFLCLIMAFLVKIPVYFFHLWLPKAHVEAPVAGSIILAGVLLKLGGYGLLRVFIFLDKTLLFYVSWLMALAILGAIFGSLICLRQSDVKSLVAYSSVAHIALVLAGLRINSYLGVAGAIIIMVAHGLCSSGLFRLVGIVYERSSRRSFLLLRRGLTIIPVLSLWWFLFRVSNIAAPPTPNLAGEILIFIRRLGWHWVLALVVGFASFLGGAFNLFIYSSTQHGNIILVISGIKDALCREHQVLFFHIVPLLLSLFILIGLFLYCCSLIKI